MYWRSVHHRCLLFHGTFASELFREDELPLISASLALRTIPALCHVDEALHLGALVQSRRHDRRQACEQDEDALYVWPWARHQPLLELYDHFQNHPPGLLLYFALSGMYFPFMEYIYI
jgi:hypothetical protein